MDATCDDLVRITIDGNGRISIPGHEDNAAFLIGKIKGNGPMQCKNGETNETVIVDIVNNRLVLVPKH